MSSKQTYAYVSAKRETWQQNKETQTWTYKNDVGSQGSSAWVAITCLTQLVYYGLIRAIARSAQRQGKILTKSNQNIPKMNWIFRNLGPNIPKPRPEYSETSARIFRNLGWIFRNLGLPHAPPGVSVARCVASDHSALLMETFSGLPHHEFICFRLALFSSKMLIYVRLNKDL